MLEQTLGRSTGSSLRAGSSLTTASAAATLESPAELAGRRIVERQAVERQTVERSARSLSIALPRPLDSAEIRRRFLHMLPGLLPFLLWAIPHPKPWGPILANVVIVLTAGIVGTSLVRFAAFARPGETDGKSSILGYAFPVFAALCLFRGKEEIGMMTLAILAFGDGSATLGGMTLGGRRLPWNPRKTWTGFLCFLFIGGPLAALVFWGEAGASVSFRTACVIGFAATATAAIAESVPSRINDNLRVGVAAVLVGAILHLFLIG